MSTFIQAKPSSKPIHSIEDLRGYFQSYAKPKGQELIGIECELFGVNRETGQALPYFGDSGIERVLKEIAYEFGYEQVQERAHTIALKKNGTIISLEPGGQVELSAHPVKSLHEVKKMLDEFFFQLRTVSSFIGSIAWIGFGIHPFSSLSEIEWVPKRRYKIMAAYLGQRGKKAHDMMKRTATNQLNLDYHDEHDAIEKMHVSFKATPIAAAMFANSSLSQGKPNGYLSERLNIWRYTAPERSGLMLDLICEHCSFRDYLGYVLDVPVMFLVRNGKWIVTRNLTFRKFIQKGYKGLKPTQTDFELHLSTIFTDARFKQYLEIRGMDGQRSHLIPAVSAFWKGILYDQEATTASLKLLADYDEHELKKLHQQVEKQGLQACIKGNLVLDLAKELVKISEQGLIRQRLFNENEQDETIYLKPLKEEILATGKTSAEKTLELWKGPFKEDPRALIDYLMI